MTALVLYIADRYLHDGNREAVVRAAKSSVCEGLRLGDTEVTVVLEAFANDNANERVAHCFFPVLYTPAGTPYAYKKEAGRLMKERLTALLGEEIPHCYFHMKEHGYDNVAVNGRLLQYNEAAVRRLDESRGEDSTPWLKGGGGA